MFHLFLFIKKLLLAGYAFHVTNPLEVAKGEKPIVEEVGPFVYSSVTVKDSRYRALRLQLSHRQGFQVQGPSSTAQSPSRIPGTGPFVYSSVTVKDSRYRALRVNPQFSPFSCIFEAIFAKMKWDSLVKRIQMRFYCSLASMIMI
jgi:hypothetical protein